jgi:hypothetical protein
MHGGFVAGRRLRALEKRDSSRPSSAGRLLDADDNRHGWPTIWLSRFVDSVRAIELSGPREDRVARHDDVNAIVLRWPDLFGLAQRRRR